MGLFFESVYRMVRDWWRALVRAVKPEPDAEIEVTDEEMQTLRVIEAATQHEEEVSAERDLGIDRSQHRIRPAPAEIVHGWTEAEFDLWWDSATDRTKRMTHLEGWTPPAGVRLAGDNWHYWNRRALDRSRRYDFKGVTVPAGHGMAGDGSQQ
jgi:hypothetical protein